MVALTTSEWKLEESIRLGADDALLMDDDFKQYILIKQKIKNDLPITAAELKMYEKLSTEDNVLKSQWLGKLDLIICTIPVSHDVTPYLHLLKPTGKLHIVGNMNEFPNLKGLNFVFFGKQITSSNVGGLFDTEEMLQFCADHKIQAEVEIVGVEEINSAIKSMVNKQARFRYAIDLENY